MDEVKLVTNSRLPTAAEMRRLYQLMREASNAEHTEAASEEEWKEYGNDNN